MNNRLLERIVTIPADRTVVFDFFSRAENLQVLTPPWLDFQILTPLPITMNRGARIDYRIRLHGVPMTWRTEITGWSPPERFEDTQLSGPYALWVHEHLFEAQTDGTRMTDRVRYRSRGGPLEPLVNRLFVARCLDRIFNFRTRALMDVFSQL